MGLEEIPHLSGWCGQATHDKCRSVPADAWSLNSEAIAVTPGVAGGQLELAVVNGRARIQLPLREPDI